MRRAVINKLRGRGARNGNGSANGGAGGAGNNFEIAAKLSHALAHAGDADAKAWTFAV
jgi:hypothetical protein